MFSKNTLALLGRLQLPFSHSGAVTPTGNSMRYKPDKRTQVLRGYAEDVSGSWPDGIISCGVYRELAVRCLLCLQDGRGDLQRGREQQGVTGLN